MCVCGGGYDYCGWWQCWWMCGLGLLWAVVERCVDEGRLWLLWLADVKKGKFWLLWAVAVMLGG